MTSLERWLTRLQLSPRSQRVLTEAALDWQHEIATALTTRERIVSHARASVGFGRACLAVMADALQTSMTWSWSLRVVVAMIALSFMHWQRMSQLASTSHFESWRMAISVWPQLAGDLPFALALAVLCGPRRSPSPVLGMAIVGALSAWGFNSYWPILVRDYLLAGKHPLPPEVDLVQSFVWLTMALTVGLTSLADRLRVDDRRLRATGVSLAQLALAVLLMVVVQQIVRAAGLPNAIGRGAVLILLIGTPPMLWFRLVRRQEHLRPTG